jgi:hypothetical protein
VKNDRETQKRAVKMSLSDWPGDTRFLRLLRTIFVHLSTGKSARRALVKPGFSGLFRNLKIG